MGCGGLGCIGRIRLLSGGLLLGLGRWVGGCTGEGEMRLVGCSMLVRGRVEEKERRGGKMKMQVHICVYVEVNVKVNVIVIVDVDIVRVEGEEERRRDGEMHTLPPWFSTQILCFL